MIIYHVVFIHTDQTMPGPDLPMALENHAMVAINNTCSMVIAGLDIDWEESALTYFYDHNEGEFVKKTL